eukprot:1157611-Pelagomonas_calceolata.AAC.4
MSSATLDYTSYKSWEDAGRKRPLQSQAMTCTCLSRNLKRCWWANSSLQQSNPATSVVAAVSKEGDPFRAYIEH